MATKRPRAVASVNYKIIYLVVLLRRQWSEIESWSTDWLSLWLWVSEWVTECHSRERLSHSLTRHWLWDWLSDCECESQSEWHWLRVWVVTQWQTWSWVWLTDSLVTLTEWVWATYSYSELLTHSQSVCGHSVNDSVCHSALTMSERHYRLHSDSAIKVWVWVWLGLGVVTHSLTQLVTHCRGVDVMLALIHWSLCLTWSLELWVWLWPSAIC